MRPGAAEAYVEGVFSLPAELQLSVASCCPRTRRRWCLARRVGADGRTRAYVNGRTAAVGDLRALGEQLVAFYGQHEHRKLTLAAAQLEILDDFCGPAQAGRLRECAQAHHEVRRLEEELEGLRELGDARERELDLLEHELGEIDAAEPQEGEEERLRAARERLRRLDALRLAAGQGARGARARNPRRSRTERRRCSPRPPRAWRAQRAWTSRSTRSRSGPARWRSRPAIWPARCATMASRWRARKALWRRSKSACSCLERLQRKHGGSHRGRAGLRRGARERREQLLGAEVAFAQTSELAAGRARGVRRTHGGAARGARAGGAAARPRPCGEQLAALAMSEATFAVELSPREGGPSGGDAVEFLIAPNPGVAAGPLREIASGGELSRVMLALMSVANAGSQAALVFDEVDAGIGGHTARAVGERLRELRGRAPGDLHHPPAPDRLARAAALLGHQGHRRGPHPRHGSPARRAPDGLGARAHAGRRRGRRLGAQARAGAAKGGLSPNERRRRALRWGADRAPPVAQSTGAQVASPTRVTLAVMAVHQSAAAQRAGSGSATSDRAR